MLDGELVELTPLNDTHSAACDMTRALGQRFYLKRSYDVATHSELWTAFDTRKPTAGGAGSAFPNVDAAVMYTIMKRD